MVAVSTWSFRGMGLYLLAAALEYVVDECALVAVYVVVRFGAVVIVCGVVVVAGVLIAHHKPVNSYGCPLWRSKADHVERGSCL